MPNITVPQPQGSMVLDLDGIIAQWSAGASALYGWEAHQAIGRGLGLLFPGQTAAELQAELQRVRGGADHRGERLARHRDGRDLWVDLHTTLMLSADGTPVGLLAVAQDATLRRKLAAEVLRQTEMEQHLIAIVSHDLRNPLQAVLLSSTLGLKLATEPRLRRYLERIETSAQRGSRLIHDLLDFNVVRHGGRLQVAARPVDLHAIVQEQLDEVLFSRPERQVKLEARGDLKGKWDPDRVAQLVGNLVTNALQHSTEEVRVTVSLRGQPEHVELEVSDEGEGIAPDLLRRLFEPHVRGHQTAATGRSVGLGLFITRAIVDAHRGTIDCVSEPGRGTSFTVRLPREERPG